MLAKRNHIDTISFDKAGLYLERTKWNIKVSNRTSKPMTEITLIEDATKYDGRLYVTSFEKFFIRPEVVDLTSKAIVRAYRSDGTHQDFKCGDQINLSTQNHNKATGAAVNLGTITPEEAVAATVEFTKVTVILEGVTLLPGQTIDGRVEMGFVDPYHLEFSTNRDIKNTVVMTATVENSAGVKSQISPEAQDSKWFVAFNESISLGGYTYPQQSGMAGEDVTFRFWVDYRNLSKSRYMDRLTIVDLFPKGVSATEDTKVGGYYDAEKYIESKKVVKNYNNTGQDAVVIVMKPMVAGDMKGGDSNVPYSLGFMVERAKINEDIIPTNAETPEYNNDNKVYAFFGNGKDFPPEISSAERIIDDRDINGNGLIDDTVLGITTKVVGNAPASLQSKKFVRSLEPVAEGGPLNYKRAWTETITTDYSGKSDEKGRFQYDLQVRNYFDVELKQVTLYDVLPFKGDVGRRGTTETSDFSNTLMGPIKINIKGTDVTSNFDIYYRTDKYPSLNPNVEINSGNWTMTPSSYEEVTAVKVVMKNGFTVKPWEILHVVLDMKSPEFNGINLSGKKGVNGFSMAYGGEEIYGESKMVTNFIEENIAVSVEKKWVGTPGAEATVNLLADGKIVDTYTLNQGNNWKHTFEPLNKMNGDQEIVYTVEEEPIEGYTAEVTGDMTSGFVVTNTKEPDKPIIPEEELTLPEPSPVEPTKAEPTSQDPGMKPGTTRPKTGDENLIGFALAILLVSGSVIVALKKREN